MATIKVNDVSYFMSENKITTTYSKNGHTHDDVVRQFQIKEISAPTDEELAQQIRAQRDSLLSQTDYLMMPDYSINDDKRKLIKEYRQALRDIPEQAGFPRTITWPEKP